MESLPFKIRANNNLNLNLMKELNLEKMEKTKGGTFIGDGEYNCKTTSIGTWCCHSNYFFWIALSRDCDWI